jgi:hypothetical protein
MRKLRALIWALGAAACLAACQGRLHDGVGRMDHALRGEIYLLPSGAAKLPDFRALKPIGAVHVRALNVPDQDWRSGFPGVTGRFEWFAVDYTGRFSVPNGGLYSFALTSDDGSRLLIDGKGVVDNDGVHGSRTATGQAQLAGGLHAVEVQYFQGPRDRVSLRLTCQRLAQKSAQPAAVFPGCGLTLKTPGLSLVWMWWLVLLAGVGAVAVLLVRRRVASEGPAPSLRRD